ncbi:hypothetical protein XFF6992_80002 [Xanthomonas citri pv. fuscans]|nr:hypothetical protein XFF6992_80002 [Xanthomonas citri pv. fuscans]SOO35042.1 hypothetical protein XFF6994_500030 [Xanthomonas citri pv. fuscans]
MSGYSLTRPAHIGIFRITTGGLLQGMRSRNKGGVRAATVGSSLLLIFEVCDFLCRSKSCVLAFVQKAKQFTPGISSAVTSTIMPIVVKA